MTMMKTLRKKTTTSKKNRSMTRFGTRKNGITTTREKSPPVDTDSFHSSPSTAPNSAFRAPSSLSKGAPKFRGRGVRNGRRREGGAESRRKARKWIEEKCR